MITIKTRDEVELMRKANLIDRDCLMMLGDHVKPGITTKELDTLAREYIEKRNAVPSFLGFEGFPGSICASVNQEVVHGIPSKKKYLEEGDIISIDCGTIYQGYQGDAARTYLVGNVDEQVRKLVEVTEQSFFEGLKVNDGVHNGLMAGVRLGDLGYAIQSYAEKFGFGVVRDLVGHGIGKEMHEDPNVPNYGKPGRGMRLLENMTIAIEPMITLGTYKVWQLEDGWTIETQDGKPASHYENSIWIKEDGVEILSLTKEENEAHGIHISDDKYTVWMGDAEWLSK